MRQELVDVFDAKDWSQKGNVPRSGKGSTLEATKVVRAALPELFSRYKIQRFLDAPCGDWHWMQHVDLNGVEYIGGDVAPSLIRANKAKFERDGVSFIDLDITNTPLPEVDLMMCRDCLMHLRHRLRFAVFRHFLGANIPYLFMTRHHMPFNLPLRRNGGFRRFSPTADPFNFPEPIEEFIETEAPIDADETTKQKTKRTMGLWSREQIAETVAAWP